MLSAHEPINRELLTNINLILMLIITNGMLPFINTGVSLWKISFLIFFCRQNAIDHFKSKST